MTVHVDVQESGAKKALENAGGAELKNSLKGEGQGLPFFAFVDAKGKMIANALQMKRKGREGLGNIGHPVRPDEVTNFMKILKKAAPKMSKAEAKVLEDWLRNQDIG